jgi:hypothetical protein
MFRQFVSKYKFGITQTALAVSCIGFGAYGAVNYRQPTPVQPNNEQLRRQVYDLTNKLDLIHRIDLPNQFRIDCPMQIWKIYKEYPVVAQGVGAKLDAGETVPQEYIRSFLTMSKKHFDQYFWLVNHNYCKGSTTQYELRAIFYLLRDIHDEHEYAFKSPDIDWPGSFDDTRQCIKYMFEYAEFYSETWIKDPHIQSEYKRILNRGKDKKSP